jgi:hypothetical protein
MAYSKTTTEDEDEDTVHCEICGAACSHQAGECETCSECGQQVCQDHVDYRRMADLGTEDPLCAECGADDTES